MSFEKPPPPPIPGEPDRILYVVRPAAGGIRQHVIELATRTDPTRFALSLAGPADFLTGLPYDLPLTQTTPLDIAPKFAPLRDVQAAKRLARLVPHPHGLVHAHGLRAALVAALAHRLRPFPFVFTAHNLVTGGRTTCLAIAFIGRRASQVITISQAVADGLVRCRIPTTKVIVIPNGVDTERFQPPPPPIMGEPDREFTVGCVARLSAEKGLDVLLKTATLMTEARFLIAGDGPEREKLHQAAPTNVHWLGRVPDTRDVYKVSDVIAVPSRQEGQGIVALEAMASGVPVVASRVGGLAEMLTEGETALLVPPDDPEALATALARLRDDLALRERLAFSGHALVREKYDVRQMVLSVEQVYLSLT